MNVENGAFHDRRAAIARHDLLQAEILACKGRELAIAAVEDQTST
jgi:hypothetical protein